MTTKNIPNNPSQKNSADRSIRPDQQNDRNRQDQRSANPRQGQGNEETGRKPAPSKKDQNC